MCKIFIDEVQRCQRQQTVQPRHSIDAIHKIVGVQNTDDDYKNQRYRPQREASKSIHKVKEQQDGKKMKDESYFI